MDDFTLETNKFTVASFTMTPFEFSVNIADEIFQDINTFQLPLSTSIVGTDDKGTSISAAMLESILYPITAIKEITCQNRASI